MVLVGTIPQPASEMPAASIHQGIERSTHDSQDVIRDEDAIGLLSGQGRIVRDHPELAALTESAAHLSAGELSALTQEYTALDETFHESVTLALTSGDPYRTADAVEHLRVLSRDIEDRLEPRHADGRGIVLSVATLAFAWIGKREGAGLSDEQFAAAVATSMSRSEG